MKDLSTITSITREERIGTHCVVCTYKLVDEMCLNPHCSQFKRRIKPAIFPCDLSFADGLRKIIAEDGLKHHFSDAEKAWIASVEFAEKQSGQVNLKLGRQDI